MFKGRKLVLTIGVTTLLIVTALAMLDPFFKQIAFGPKYDGVPLVVWQDFLRERARPPSLLDRFHDSIITLQPNHWGQLPRKDRCEILLTVVDEPSIYTQRNVAHFLRIAPSSTPYVVKALENCLRSEDETVRRFAAESALELDEPPIELIGALLNQLDDPYPPNHFGVIRAIVRLGNDNPRRVLPEIFTRLKEGKTQERVNIMYILSGIRPTSKEEISAIRNATKDPEERVTKVARQALSRLGVEVAE